MIIVLQITSKIKPYLEELERFETFDKKSFEELVNILELKTDSCSAQTFSELTQQILNKMLIDLDYLAERLPLIEKFARNIRSREALIPKDELIKKQLYEENNLNDKLTEWLTVYGFAERFIDKPKETASLVYMMKLNSLIASQSTERLKRHYMFRDSMKKADIVLGATDYLLEHIDGFGITEKMIKDSASLKIFLLYTIYTKAKPYTMKRIIEGIFNNLGYKLEVKLDKNLAKKALPIAYFNKSVILGYSIRQEDNIFSDLYKMFESMLDYIENEIDSKLQTETNKSNRLALLETKSRLSFGFVGMYRHMLVS